MGRNSHPTLLGLDLNATRARAVEGAPGAAARPILLESPHPDLPLALALEGRAVVVGRAALGLCRRAPHLVCLDFLPHLDGKRSWGAGRHRLDAPKALGLVAQRLRASVPEAATAVVALPAYLTPSQVELVVGLAEAAQLRLGAWLSAPLAAALAAWTEAGWTGPALVLDADEHALTVTLVTASDRQMQAGGTLPLPQLGLRTWRERVLGALADRCVRQSRRDPRDSADAEQGLFDQLDHVLDTCRRGQVAEVIVQMAHWGQNLLVRPDELSTACAPFVRQALAAVHSLRALLPLEAPAPVVLLTDAAARLPGLVPALEEAIGIEPVSPPGRIGHEDFSESLLEEEEREKRRGVNVLPSDAPARAAWELAGRLARGDVSAGALGVVPLPPPGSVESGPARLHFCGQDYVLSGHSFVLGRQADCDLVFDSAAYPTVSGRHCEIVCERRTYILRDRSRNGTLVNERPVVHEIQLRGGDWIRLGPGGPLIRFLGRAADGLRLITTA